MNNERLRVYLAALLHDIGKFYQRADQGSTRDSRFLSDEIKNLETQLCPLHSSQNYRTHKHVLWTAQFFADHESVFRGLFPHEPGGQGLLQLSAAHHLPSSDMERLIQKADWLSSGVDRTSALGIEDAAQEHKPDTFKRVQMRSVFELIEREKEQNAFHPEYILPVATLGQSWPKKAANPSTGVIPYHELWKAFESDFRNIPAGEPWSFLESLLSLLEKYTSFIPSSTVHLPDVSLYDHLKTTAALALCLYDFEQSDSPGIDQSAFLLIGATLSGIQSYIYDIISKHAAKNLKGRSFYLQILTDSVLMQICRKLSLPSAHVIYASGGGFFLLAPNTPKVHAEISRIETLLGDYLWKEQQNRLYIAMAGNSFSEKDLFDHKLGEVWTATIEKMNHKKQNRYADRLVSEYDALFVPFEVGGATDRDAISGEEIPAGVPTRSVPLRDGTTGEKVMETTFEQILLGKNLKKADFHVVSEAPVTYWQKENVNETECLGIRHYLLSREKLTSLSERFKGSIDGVKVLAINRTSEDFLQAIPGSRNSYGYSFYGGNDFPAHPDGEPKTFDELAGRTESGKTSGFTRLGILRMDVDNLGRLFGTGFRRDRQTFSRYSALSRGLDFFFKGYLNEIWADPSLDLQNHTQILYAGGDDLFIVGKWTACITFAEQIHQKFAAYVCHNPNLSLSGGLAIVPAMFPVSMGAAMAAEAEKSAKGHDYNHHGKSMPKNAFSLLGEALNWQYEYPLVKLLKNKLTDWVTKGYASRALLGKIYAHYYGYETQRRLGQSEAWRWTMAYDFGRYAKSLKDDTLKAEIHAVKQAAFTDTYEADGQTWQLQGNRPFLQLLNLAARWAELEIRTY
ncbi:MAG: type III-A CRISPR-associated protein Cas10/Csm1 [Bacteroidia bacterium]